jgi:hypothetical protein
MDAKPEGNVEMVESIHGNFHYHLKRIDVKQRRSLCGAMIMACNIPLSAWGTVSHLRESYCEECLRLSPYLGKE